MVQGLGVLGLGFRVAGIYNIWLVTYYLGSWSPGDCL